MLLLLLENVDGHSDLKGNHICYMVQVTAYYVQCAKTNNHTVREAACQCIAELFTKIERTAVNGQLAKLQRTLRRCLKDDSWTVRPVAIILFLDFQILYFVR